MPTKNLTIVIPCFNEEKGIKQVLEEIKSCPLDRKKYSITPLVIDNNCTDRTAEIAKKMGAKVICELKKGKGNALRTAFRNIPKNCDFVFMMDGDATYKAKEIPRLLEPLENDFADVIVGSRLEGKMIGKAMSVSHRLANWLFTFIVRYFYGANVTDTCTGFFAWKREAITKLNGYIKSPGFAIEAEMITKMSRLKYKVYSVPITYEPRHGDSKLSPFGDGLRITWMLLRNRTWKPRN
jgi:glycosyltransferase involved in cell wall biosynthesis